MALGDRYFEYTKSIYNNFVVYLPLPVQAAVAPPVPFASSRSPGLSTEQVAFEQLEGFPNQVQNEWLEGIEYDKEKENEDQNPNRGLFFILGIIARAIVKPFALAGALLGDLLADIIRIPVDLVKGLVNLFKPARAKPEPAELKVFGPKNQYFEDNSEAPLPAAVAPQVHVNPKEAQELVKNPLDNNRVAKTDNFLVEKWKKN